MSCTINTGVLFCKRILYDSPRTSDRKGFADVCFIPREIHLDKPAVLIELKWDKSAAGALSQIKEKQYTDTLKQYQGNLLLVGINYDKITKEHTCVIEKAYKE